MHNIIFFGPPGAGKGTQAKIISSFLEIPHLSTGDILRSKIKQEDKLANKLREIMSSGKLVSDDILNKIFSEKLNDCKNGFILDGYPRTLDQSFFLTDFLKNSLLKIDYIFNIQIEFEILKNRIIKRSLEEDRDDDNIEVINTRYNAYNETTQKASLYFKNNYQDIFFEINGDQEIEEITYKIKKILKNS